MSLLPVVRSQRWFALCALLFSFAAPSPSLAQVPYYYDVEDPAREARRQEKLRIRAERETQARQHEVERKAEYMRHPLALAAVAIPDVFALGMDGAYVGGFAGIDTGLRVKREFEHVSLRVSGLARFAHGHVSSWDFTQGGHDGYMEQALYGAELQTELAFRIGGFFIAPTFSAGYVHLRKATLDERDFPDEHGKIPERPEVVEVPGNAALLATGFALGGEGRASHGRVGGAVRAMGGPWNDMQHVYLQLGVVLSVVFWENER